MARVRVIKRKPKACARCKRSTVQIHARGLCHTCYRQVRELDALDAFPLLKPGKPVGAIREPTDAMLKEWASLRDDGISTRVAAPRLGMTWQALERALYRAQKRGDPRGYFLPYGRDTKRKGGARKWHGSK